MEMPQAISRTTGPSMRLVVLMLVHFSCWICTCMNLPILQFMNILWPKKIDVLSVVCIIMCSEGVKRQFVRLVCVIQFALDWLLWLYDTFRVWYCYIYGLISAFISFSQESHVSFLFTMSHQIIIPKGNVRWTPFCAFAKIIFKRWVFCSSSSQWTTNASYQKAMFNELCFVLQLRSYIRDDFLHFFITNASYQRAMFSELCLVL